MLSAWQASTIRAAEEPLLASLPGVLMQRAANALATAVLAELRRSRLIETRRVSLVEPVETRRGSLVERVESRPRSRAYGSRVLLAVGPGNNGGDALFAGAMLARRGVVVRAWLVAGRAHAEGLAAFRAAGGRDMETATAAALELQRADLVVDGVVGMGGRAGLSPEVAMFAQAAASAKIPVVAVDLPSGLDADSSTLPPNAFRASLTVTFGGHKPCHLMEPARSACGRVQLVDLGLALPEPQLLQWEPADVASVWPLPTVTSDKYSRGVVGLDVGSARYPGAGVLAALGATHSGAGMVRFTGVAEAAARVVAAAPNVVVGEGRVEARVLGCGWGNRPDGIGAVARALAGGVPVVLDADALRFLPRGPLPTGVLLTPHAGELARLLGRSRAEVTADPIGAVAEAVERTGATVLLKGATQYVLSPEGEPATLAVPGPAWSAQAGSGDVLAGSCGALLAAGLTPREAALAAASVQALTAAAHPGPWPPQAIAERLPATIAVLTTRPRDTDATGH
jgi:hydroxyethylthiazole kinase-like uncharacterized protein yjeF